MKKKAIKATPPNKKTKPRVAKSPPHRYVIKVEQKIRGEVWWVGVIDTKDGQLVSLDKVRAGRLFYSWYRQHKKIHPRISHTPCMYTNGLVDLQNGEIFGSGDPVMMLVEVWPA